MLRKFLLPLLLVFPLAACYLETPNDEAEKVLVINPNNVGSDGYQFEQAEFFRDAQSISIIVYPDKRALQIAAAKNGLLTKNDYETVAFSFWLNNKPVCQIHIVDPRIHYDPNSLGHEMTHCIFGEFHPTMTKITRR